MPHADAAMDRKRSESAHVLAAFRTAREIVDGGTLLTTSEATATLAEAEPCADPRFCATQQLLADFAGGNIDKGAVAFAAGRVHAAMAALVSARRPGTIKVRASHPEQTMEWTPDERAAVEGLRRLQAAGKAGDPNRWLKTWMELPPRAVELVVAEAGGYAAFALAPWLIAARPFGLPGPEGIAPLLPQAIARASAKGRPPEALRDMAAIAVLHAAAAVLGNPDEPPTGWSNPKSEFRSLLARIEHAYAGIPPEEDPARLPAEERRGLKAAGMAKPSPARSALNLGSAATLTRLVAAAFPTRTA